MDIDINADMKASRAALSEPIINLLKYSVEDYRLFVTSTIEREGECCTMDRCHEKTHIQEIGGEKNKCLVFVAITSKLSCKFMRLRHQSNTTLKLKTSLTIIGKSRL